MAPRRRCPTCGSRQWHKEPSSGLIACSEGHVLQNYRKEVTDTDNLGQHALMRRAIKSGRKKKEAESEANPALYHGARGRYHYFECLQLILRKQVAVLMKLWALPQEFEVVCRDIWALHLELLSDPPSAEPYYFALELRDGDINERGSDSTGVKDKKNVEGDESREDESRDEEEEGQEEKSHDEELEALLRANSDLEDSSDDDGENEEQPSTHARKIQGRRRRVYQGPASNIAVLMVGCWTLRVPALCRDFTRLIELYELPYLDPIRRRLLPESMVVHLTKHNAQAMSPYDAPSTQLLHGLASRLSKMMYTSFGIFTPEANAAPILWRVVSRGLGGTPMLYRLTKRLGQILSLPLTLHHTLAPGLEKRTRYDPERHVYDNVAPEVSWMGVAIIVLKMVYGFDGQTRTPIDGADVACGLARADEFLTGLEKLEKGEQGEEVNLRTDVWKGDLNGEMMDAYLDFSERVLIGDGDGGREGHAVLDRFFPVVPGEARQRTRGGDASGEREAITADGTAGLRPGEGYRLYRGHDVGGAMGAEWGAVVGRGARWTGVGVEALSAVVEAYERRLARWRPRAADVIIANNRTLAAELAVDHDDLAAMHRFVAVFKRDKHSPPPLVADQANSSASSSTGSASLCLHTPDDDQHLPVAVERQASRRSWRLWLKGSLKKTPHPVLWVPPSHDVEDVPSVSSLHDDPPGDPLQSFTVLVQNSLQPSPSPPSPFSRRSDDPSIFPKSANRTSLLPRTHSLAQLTLKRHILKRLQDERHTFSEPELRSIAPLASRSIIPVVPLNQPHHPFNVSAPSESTIISTSCPGLATWVSRPCFEDRYDLFMPEQDGTISHRPIIGSNLAVAALEFSEGLEAMADSASPQFVVDISSETVSISPPSSGYSRSPPHIPAPSPLRNENLPAPPTVSASQSAPPAVPTSTETDFSVKRGVRFVEDGKDDVIPLGYVLRMKKKREEKAKFLKAEQERRLLQDERMRHEEERRKRDAERAEWERERRAWEKEKRVMEEERRQRKFAEEVLATRLRRESQRAGGVPALKASESNAFLGPGAGFQASAPSPTSERNRPSPAHRYSRLAYNDSGAPAFNPRREASEPNLPTRIDTNTVPSLPITPSPRSHSPSSSPASVNIERPLSPDMSSPLPGVRPSSTHSSQELPSPLENVKAAAATAANRDKRHSIAASISTSRNNSNISLLVDRATSYPVWTGSNHSLNSVLAPVPLIHPMQMPMMPVPAYAMMDMPLLPPAPPFMMQQYPRHHGSPGSPGSGGGSPKGRLGGSSTSSSRERLDSQNQSRERVNIINGATRSGSVERGYVSDRSNKESRGHSSRSASFPRPEAPRHTSPSSAQVSNPASQGTRHGHMQPSSPTGPSSRRTGMTVSHPQSPQRPRQASHDLRPSPPTHTRSQPVLMSQSSTQNPQVPSPWTGLPTQSGNLPNANSNGNGSRGSKNVPPRHMSYSGVRSEGVRQSNMRADPPRQAKRQTLLS